MSASAKVPAETMVEAPCPYREPLFRQGEAQETENLTLIDGKSFLATTISGDIVPPSSPDVGLFFDDTRFLSHLELRVQGQRTVVLSSSTELTYSSQIELTTASLAQINTIDLPENTLHVRREQILAGNTFYDSIAFENFSQKEVALTIDLVMGADFIDIFQVRGTIRGRCGRYFQPVFEGDSLTFFYEGLDGMERQTRLRFSPAPARFENQTAVWQVVLPPLQRLELLTEVVPFTRSGTTRSHTGHETAEMPSASSPISRGPTSLASSFRERLQHRRRAFAEWETESTRFCSGNDVFDRAMATATGDLHALQIPDGQEYIIAAGIPWFATIFGRDAILAAFQSLVLNPTLARGTLRVLARYQGKEVNDWRDEEPGKIIHEQRSGEMSRTNEIPFGAYYGSVDATPLFLILLCETFNWTADEQMLSDLMPAALAALDWIDRYGDLDGDGLVEYKRRSPKGLTNQGWKDSWDANMHSDGSVAAPPIALVEVQGYVYDAKFRMASILRHFGDSHRADRCKREASEMLKRIDRHFWMPQRRYFAMGLDGGKRQLQGVNSNAGHLLFSRAISRERARCVVAEMMRDGLFSGWGLRTLSREERIFNPLSYHRGSVWPHDNSLIAHGMALLEFRKEAARVFTGLFQTAVNFRDYRLPELFCGVQRREFDEPVHYPVSCSPQAWASGAMFLMLTSLLGIRPSAPSREMHIVNPILPEWLDFLQIRNLRIGKSRVGLDFTRKGDRTYCNVVDVEGDKLLINVAFRK